MDSQSIAVGSRIVCEGYYGTVRYIGVIEDSAVPQWVGVEWDDATRGKHDGCHNGMIRGRVGVHNWVRVDAQP